MSKSAVDTIVGKIVDKIVDNPVDNSVDNSVDKFVADVAVNSVFAQFAGSKRRQKVVHCAPLFIY